MRRLPGGSSGGSDRDMRPHHTQGRHLRRQVLPVSLPARPRCSPAAARLTRARRSGGSTWASGGAYRSEQAMAERGWRARGRFLPAPPEPGAPSHKYSRGCGPGCLRGARTRGGRGQFRSTQATAASSAIMHPRPLAPCTNIRGSRLGCWRRARTRWRDPARCTQTIGGHPWPPPRR